ncbi:MAG: type II toxin-antitoxin system ParD family antitoxin [Sphingomonadaceae bacterium]
MSQLNISIPPALKAWVDSRVAEGSYSSASDYMRDLVRRDRQAAEEEEAIWLRGLIEEGLASGVIDKPAREVLQEIVADRYALSG